MYDNFAQLLGQCEAQGRSLDELILEDECLLTGRGAGEVMEALEERYQVMAASAGRALHQPLGDTLISGTAQVQQRYALSGHTVCGPLINRVMARALSCSECNAAMGRICAAPTAGACGILPAVLLSLEEAFSTGREAALRALLTASGVGAVIVRNATVSGAEGGCQAECGVAAAMAAASAAQLMGGTPAQALDAAALALMNVMGLVCDPVAGLVQVPCAQRNASQAVNALISCDLALSGMRSLIPLDEVVEAMYRVGRQLPPALRETALGGVAATPTAQAIQEALQGRG